MPKVIINAWTGMFGVRMHEYAFAKTFAKKNNFSVELLSTWEGSVMFKNSGDGIIENEELRTYLANSGNSSIEERNKKTLEFYPNALIWDANRHYKNPYENNNRDIITNGTNAYQESIFEGMSLLHIKDIFELSDIVKNSYSYKYWEERKGTYDVAHLRRNDIADVEYNLKNEQGYSVISLDSYYKAFDTFGYRKDKIEWISDDYINKWHKDRPKTKRLGWQYPEGAFFDEEIIFDWLDDWLKMYFARTVFRANSSFAFWACLLSPTAKVFSPVVNKQLIYGRNGLTEEIDVDFTEGNQNHWMYSDPYRQIKIL